MHINRQLNYKKLSSSSKKRGFTLAEVLLVITIIGIIASYTVPGLLNSVSNNQYTAALKKNYSVIANAYRNLEADGTTMTAAFPGTNTGAAALNVLAPKLNLIKNCGISQGCLYNSLLKYLKGTICEADFDANWDGTGGKAILGDGSRILIQDYRDNCTHNIGTGALSNSVCGWLLIDVNGAKGPNTVGRDVFEFWIAKTGVYPSGSNGDWTVNDCNSAANGESCASIVLTQGMNN